jgi:hypothetical protein
MESFAKLRYTRVPISGSQLRSFAPEITLTRPAAVYNTMVLQYKTERCGTTIPAGCISARCRRVRTYLHCRSRVCFLRKWASLSRH